MSTLNATNLKNPSSGSNNIVLGTDGTTALGTTKVTAITDSAGANSSTPAAIANGTAKAWVNFNGAGTVAIRASFNVSSITDNGTGDYTVNFTTALVDANYAATSYGDQQYSFLGATPTSSAIRVRTVYKNIGISDAPNYADSAHVYVAIFR